MKFVLVDFKMCQFSLYANIHNHFLATFPNVDEVIITNPLDTLKILKSLCLEVDDRLALLEQTETSNIEDYNERITNRESNTREQLRFLPYIIVIIDEFADLMECELCKEIEEYLLKLLSKSKAVGIHMIISTQRPSPEIITDKIKGNCKTRIAFRTYRDGDSKLIIDDDEADYLIGRGDMLLSYNGKMQRLQASYIDYTDAEAIVNHINAQSKVEDTYYLPATNVQRAIPYSL